MITITLYGKPNCHLCEEALEVIHTARQEYAFELIVRNILENYEDFERYKHDIPVIVLNGVELARHRLTEEQLTSALARQRSAGYNGGQGATP
jgi:glutaredoxin